MMKLINNIGTFLIEWIVNLFMARLYLIVLCSIVAFMFYSPPYTITSANGNTIEILSSFKPSVLTYEFFKWFAIVEFFGFTYFLNKIMDKIQQYHKNRR
jgi:hypothetical protein